MSSLPSPGRAGTPSAVKLWVRETGVQKVSAADLAAALAISEATASDLIRKGRLALSLRNAPVAWQADGSSLLFYGQASDSLYSAESVYWLAPGKSLLIRTAAGGSPPSAASPLTFPDTVHVEKDSFPAIAIAPDPEADYWYWDVLVAGDPSYGTRSLAFDLKDVAPSSRSTSSLTVHLQGATASGVPAEHHAAIRLNGTPVGEASWQGITPYDVKLAVDGALLREGSNTVEVTEILDSGVPYSIAYVDSIDVSYPRRYQASGSSLLL
ncbi:MAG: hypothetical protein ABUL63_03470, partial [Acidobacteriota bacterium]